MKETILTPCWKCRYEDSDINVMPCSRCCHAWTSKFEPKTKTKSIRERIVNMLGKISFVGGAVDILELKSLLIELRDREEDE